MSGANASPIGRSHQEVSGAREAQARQGADGNNASPTRSASAIARSLKKGRSHQEMNRRQFLLVWCPTSCLTPIWGRCIPLLAKEGWTRHEQNGSVPKKGADGVVAYKRCFGMRL